MSAEDDRLVLQNAAQQGDEEAAIKAREEAAERLRSLRKTAEQGDMEAQFNVGHLYFNGDTDIPEDYAKAAKWFGKAMARQGALVKGCCAPASLETAPVLRYYV